jgi:signal transduction histidine kinase
VQKLFSRPPVWVFWTLISLACFAVSACSSLATPREAASSLVITMSKAELNLNPARDVPTNGWIAETLPANGLSRRAQPTKDGAINAWARMSFTTAQFQNQPVALYTENNREGVVIFLNRTEVFRNAPNDNARVMGWNHPYLVPLPKSLLRSDNNEIIVRVSSRQGLNLSIGQVRIGPQAELVKVYNFQHALRISGPMAANFTMLFLTVAVLFLYILRPTEPTLVWIALTGVFWFIRNFHFFAYEAPFDPKLFMEVSYYAVFFAIAASLSFCVDFLKLPNRKLIVWMLFGFCIFLSLLRFVVVSGNGPDGLINLASLAIVVVVTMLLIKDWFRRPTLDHGLLVSSVLIIVGLSIHDIGRSTSLGWWDGMGFHAQPYIGLLLFSVFMVSIGRRFIEALNAVELANHTLEVRVASVRAELAQSEFARRELEVINAVESERERLMREMHDGIGSNLITALAIAKQADESPRTINTLKKAISDLKITVDSLAPVEGDLVSLLANFRHRLEPELKEAGLNCIWKVQPCPSLPWLDAVNALQMLRIIQEAVGNVLVHSGATQIEIGAMPYSHSGQSGVQTWVADNGQGLSQSSHISLGRGFGNMRARTLSLNGDIQFISSAEQGLKVLLWLPLMRPRTI